MAEIKKYFIGAAVALAVVAIAAGVSFRVFSSPTPAPASNSPILNSPTTVPPTQSPTPVPPITSPTPSPVAQDQYPAWGPESALVTIIEFSDFQCPACQTYATEMLPLIRSTYGDRVRYVFRNMPVVASHPQAQKAAEAALCAFEQGKFWEYHDLLYQNQSALDVPSLKGYAAALGLDLTIFNLSLDSGKYTQEVQKSFNDGIQMGVTSVPALFINGRKVEGAKPFSAFQQIIDEELAKAGSP